MDLKELRERYINGEKFSYIFFFGHKCSDKLTNACFSQWYPATFSDNERTYNCAEQYMMAQKAILFNDFDTLKLIMSESDPAAIKKLGRKVKNFNSDVWDKHCQEIVQNGSYLKFSQNEDLKKYLLATKDKILVEASPYDAIWGIKMRKEDLGIDNPLNWKGTNFLGFSLMYARDKIKNENI